MIAWVSGPAGRPESMQNHRADRYANVRLAALLVTVLLHGLVFWWGLNSARLSHPSREKIQAIRVFLQPLALSEPPPQVRPNCSCAKPLPVAKAVAVPPPVAVPREIPPSPTPVVLSPAISPPPVAAAAPAPLSSPAALSLAPLPVAAAVVVPAPPLAVASRSGNEAATGAMAAATAAAVVGTAGAAVSTASPAAVAGSGAAGGGKELYLRSLFAHIEAHKFYPPAARRRQLEGQVRVAFTIEPSGQISNLKVSEGHPQLEEAARQTVLGALPLPLPAAGVTLPFALTYRMEFRLR